MPRPTVVILITTVVVMQTASLHIVGDTGEAIHKHQGVGVRVKCACEIWYQQLICHASCLSTPGDAQTIEAAWCRHDVQGRPNLGRNDASCVMDIFSAVKSNQLQYFVKSTSNWPKSYSITK